MASASFFLGRGRSKWYAITLVEIAKHTEMLRLCSLYYMGVCHGEGGREVLLSNAISDIQARTLFLPAF